MPYHDLNSYRKNAALTEFKGFSFAYWHQYDSQLKDTIVFIHGFPSASWDWHHQWEYFKGNYNLLAMDMLGYGLSDKPLNHNYSLVGQADFIQALLEFKQIENCHVVAHDYGDSVAQELLFRHHKGVLPTQLKSVCFLNGGLFSESHRPLLMQKLLSGRLGPVIQKFMSKGSLNKGLARVFSQNRPPTEQEIDVLWQLLNHKDGRAVLPKLLGYMEERKHQRNNWLEAMQKTNVPLKLINGKLDPVSGLHLAERYQELITDSKVVLLEAGHYPQIELPEAVSHEIEVFLKID